jgi:hypothetical protein
VSELVAVLPLREEAYEEALGLLREGPPLELEERVERAWDVKEGVAVEPKSRSGAPTRPDRGRPQRHPARAQAPLIERARSFPLRGLAGQPDDFNGKGWQGLAACRLVRQ